ncbi:hypothetical protein [Amycolatopsis suaedae]|uniref:Hydantoinase/oxoprolinase n=1 Tax=Amycolatopsis suaedae TaxID=2510978 RepID=A0A4Q7J2D2_9PSEU|nr:hypothetical protein [Amycolatopsis suaedae]RZQ60104.1 hypothetical protein EWH70_30855 [Amycolatopsis suaedae]
MNLPQPRFRLGLCWADDSVSAALLDPDDEVLAATGTTAPAPDSSWHTVVAGLTGALLEQPGARGIVPGDVDRVLVSASAVAGFAGWPDGIWPPGIGGVAVLRLGAATTAVPPLGAWPPPLRDRIAVDTACVAGGSMLDGEEFEPLDRAAVSAFADRIAGRAAAVAVTGVFAAVRPGHELEAAALLHRRLGDAMPVVTSHEFGGLGLLDRENATVLQAALIHRARAQGSALQAALADAGFGDAEVFVGCHDGTVAALDHAVTHPLPLHGGVNAATAAGAGRLAGVPDALVLLSDVDGRQRAVCTLADGMPRLDIGPTLIAGIPTQLRVPALVSTANTTLDEALDRAKPGPDDLPVLLAGAGATALAARLPARIPGVSTVRRPPHAEAAAAVGVACAAVRGRAYRIVAARRPDADGVREEARAAARTAAVLAGADPGGVRVTAVRETPLPYLSEPAMTLNVVAEGPPRPGLREPSPRRVVASRARR